MAGTVSAPALYVHVPFCVAKCPYCAFYSVAYEEGLFDRYLAALRLELDRYAEAFPARTVYVGGGSPSCLPQARLHTLLGTVIERAGTGEEVTVEVNPGQVNGPVLAMLRQSGVNRLSIGVQALEDDFLKRLGRPYPAQTAREAIQQARAAGFDNIGIDLIFAVPGMDLAGWRRQLEGAIAAGVDHISAYSLSYEPGTPFHAWAAEGRIAPVSDETDRASYEMAIDLLEDAGLHQYEISNFSRSGYECRHNRVYWLNDPWIGVGPAAGSWFGGRRTLNSANAKRWIDAIDAGREPFDEVARPQGEELAHETGVLMLRMTEGIRYDRFETQTGFDARILFGEAVRKWAGLGFIEQDATGFRLTRPARAVADSILCEFV